MLIALTFSRYGIFHLLIVLLSACSSLPEPGRQAQLDAQSVALAEHLQQRWQTHPLLQNYQNHFLLSRTPVRPDALSGHMFVIIPGWLHQSQPTTGADLARQREVLIAWGAKVHMANVDENTTVEANAQRVLLDLYLLAKSHESIILLSASKGGPEAALALSEMAKQMPAPLAQRIKAWVNIGGTLRGTALADHALDWRVCWLVSSIVVPGGSMEGIRSLSPQTSAIRHRALLLPAHVQVVNLLGIANGKEISERGKQGYALLSDLGANDGITLLEDALIESAPTVVLRGADHYFNLPDLDRHTAALALALIETLRTRQSP